MNSAGKESRTISLRCKHVIRYNGGNCVRFSSRAVIIIIQTQPVADVHKLPIPVKTEVRRHSREGRHIQKADSHQEAVKLTLWVSLNLQKAVFRHMFGGPWIEKFLSCAMELWLHTTISHE